jgi:hypothetical protein
MTLFELWPERLAGHYGRTCQPWLGHGVLLGKSWWGKRMFVVFSPSYSDASFFASIVVAT